MERSFSVPDGWEIEWLHEDWRAFLCGVCVTARAQAHDEKKAKPVKALSVAKLMKRIEQYDKGSFHSEPSFSAAEHIASVSEVRLAASYAPRNIRMIPYEDRMLARNHRETSVPIKNMKQVL